ncbi:MAG: response regulator [Rivularia sp. (in: Bacteria)]|nr:response regulator [Rivularia sp. MS3]
MLPYYGIKEFKANILIIDDEPDNLRLLSTILQYQNYKVRQAVNAEIALKTIELQLPDLILLDILMPEVDGYQLCEQIKNNPLTKEIPVIFLSALARGLDRKKGFQVGAADYLTKPFELEEVLAKVKNQLTICDLKRQLTQKNQELSELKSKASAS